MNIDTKNMETFIQVAELCSFTKAAKKLGYSQSTVSFQIRQLEEMLNVRLLERINHTVALTEAGRKVLNYAHRLEQLTVDMEKELRPQPSVSGHVATVGRPEGAQLCPSSGTADSGHGKRIKAAALCKRPCAHGSGRFPCLLDPAGAL